jgi:predicted naringenin-chalcone synthase
MSTTRLRIITERILANGRRNLMTQLNANIPASLYKQIESLAARENISIEQLVAIALSAQVECLDDQRLFRRKIEREEVGKSLSKFWLKFLMWNQKIMTSYERDLKGDR